MALYKKTSKPLALKRVRFDVAPDTYINLRELSSQELIHYQEMMGDKETSNLDFIYDLVSKCAEDDEQSPLFSDAADVKANFNIGLSTLVDIQKQVMHLSGLDTQKN